MSWYLRVFGALAAVSPIKIGRCPGNGDGRATEDVDLRNCRRQPSFTPVRGLGAYLADDDLLGRSKLSTIDPDRPDDAFVDVEAVVISPLEGVAAGDPLVAFERRRLVRGLPGLTAVERPIEEEVGLLAIGCFGRAEPGPVVADVDPTVSLVDAHVAHEVVDEIAVPLGQVDRRRPGCAFVIRVGEIHVEVAGIRPVSFPRCAVPCPLCGPSRLVEVVHGGIDPAEVGRIWAAVDVHHRCCASSSLALRGIALLSYGSTVV